MKKVIPRSASLIPANATRVFKGQIYDTYQWPQQLFDGSEATFEMLRRPDTVEVIGVTGDKIIVVKDEQPNRSAKLSFPGGRVDETDANTLAAAKREVHEETGYEFEHWRLVKVWQPLTKIEWFIYLYLAWEGNKTAEPHVDAGERIEVEQVSFERVKQLVFDKAGYLGEAQGVFEGLQNADELLALARFEGTELER